MERRRLDEAGEQKASWKSRILAFVAVALALLIAGCASLPSLDGRTPTHTLTDTAATALGRTVTPLVAANPGKTGTHVLADPHDSFAARVYLAQTAEKTLDAQYFIWHGDQVGYLLFEALWQAAERGVRVRLLLDDINTVRIDSTIAALGAHPNIEVRLYNPLVYRKTIALNFLTDFSRVNRRMHNKSFTADNQVSIVGGRNIANEYFAAGSGLWFTDLDVAALGAVVNDVSKEFDLYWNSLSAYPAASFVGAPGPEAAADLKATFSAKRADPESVDYLAAVRETPLIRDLLNKQVALEWTTARLVYDDPAKTLDTTGEVQLLFPELVRALGRPEKTIDLVSPYFIPGTSSTAALKAEAARGVKVRILTNSLAASDESAVHAFYAKHRRELLEAGIQIYERMPTVSRKERKGKSGYGSRSTGALHAKTFAVDRSRIFVGSFNFDQRSKQLNTEMGLVLDNPAFAERLSKYFDTEVPKLAYEVRLTPDGDLDWIEQTPSGEKHYDTDPGTSWFLRRKIDILSIFPIEWLL